MAKQAALSRVVRQDVSDNVVQVAADGGLDERLLRYLDVAADDEAARLLNALEGASDSRRLTQVVLREEAPASFQRQLARQFSEGELDTDDVRTALRRIDETSDPAVRDSLYRTVSEGGSNGARLLARTDNLDAVKRLVSDPEVGADARTLIRQSDSQQILERLFEIDSEVTASKYISRNTAFDGWDAWRAEVARANAQPGTSSTDIDSYIDASYRVAKNDDIKIEGDLYNEHKTDLTGTRKLDERLAEMRQTEYYADRLSEYDGVRVVAEPQFDGTNSDVDVGVDTSSAPDRDLAAVAEIKSTQFTEDNILNQLLDANRKFDDIGGEISSVSEKNRILTIEIDGNPSNKRVTELVRGTAEQNKGVFYEELNFGTVRVIKGDGSPVVVDLSKI